MFNYVEIDCFRLEDSKLCVVDKGSEGYFMVITSLSGENIENEKHRPINQALYYALLESNQDD